MEEYRICIEVGGLTSFGSTLEKSSLNTGNIFLMRERRVLCLFDTHEYRLKYVREFDGTKYYTLEVIG